MKKIVVVTCFFALAFSLRAQNDIRFGFQASPTFGWMNAKVNHINTSGTNLGLKLGMIGEYYFRENYAFTSGIGFFFNAGGGLLYDYPGKYLLNSDLPPAYDSLGAMSKIRYHIQYIEIPAGLKLKTREFGYWRYYFEPAITIGIKSQARGQLEGIGIQDGEDKYNIRKEVNGLNLSWGIGAGAEYSISENTSLVVGAAFQIGFTDATDDDKDKVYYPDPNSPGLSKKEDSKASVYGITLRLGVMF